MSYYSITSGVSLSRIRHNVQVARRRRVIATRVWEYVVIAALMFAGVFLATYPVQIRDFIFWR